ncbi:M1 family aminopeptidase [Flavivirga abyssicola]|uniref:M1 family metallopeptidase n=1 Tax=Flavivirga abyssicola TaxID=3063533 RepID=UPI0026E0656D|nr:M1 family aminopeptidase [Flavivirga sp. MEBiC07777]WVK14382.1 M1 family aminopeptidase [Flavivirga sp. MEBiC07777]
MKNFLYLLCFLMLFSCDTKQRESMLLSEGISLDLSTYRKTQVEDVVYNLKFNIPLKKEDSIASELKLNLKVKDLESPLYLDFNEKKSFIKNVIANGKVIEVNHKQEHLIISETDLKLGNNTIDISFIAGELSLNRNDDYLYTLLVPDRASTLFPCFDQPDIKANYILDITAPKSWKVLCGSKLNYKEDKQDYTRYVFHESDKMSTYLFSFVAGVFNRTTQNLGSFDMKLLYRENNEAKIKASMDEIFKLHQESVNFLEDYTQKEFPFQKMDYASIPGFQYGGMEHVGAIQYRESSLFLDESATLNQKLNRGKLIAHETSHMWFGNLVTMKWFNDVWLKEVFANFMADKIANPTFPDINHTLEFMSDHYPSAYSEDRTRGATPIRQNLDNLKNAGTLYGNIIYHKAPIMMRQLEAAIGEDNFKKGLRNYIQKFANTNADWNDLINLLSAETDIDLKQWSRVWVTQPGRPIIMDSIIYQNNKIKTFEISQKAEDGSDNIWPQTFNIGLIYQDTTLVKTVRLKNKRMQLEEVIGMKKPKTIVYNYDAFGYGVFPIDVEHLKILPSIKNDEARGYAYINLYENMLAGLVTPTKAFNLLLEGIESETEEQIVSLISRELSSVFWNFLTFQERFEAQQLMEPLLQGMLNKDLDSGIKKTLFNLYKGIAYSINGKLFLYDVWTKKIEIKGLNLNENDYTSIASALAIYNHAKIDEILEVAKTQITNPDTKKRFEYLLPSLSNDEKVRDDFMNSFFEADHRTKESWVLSALGNIHHPLRQKSAEKHLRACLNALEDIQLTGDIFFPKNWLNNTIGRYSSKNAYHVVEAFLVENPDFSPVLKNKLLQSVDILYRAQKIKYSN